MLRELRGLVVEAVRPAPSLESGARPSAATGQCGPIGHGPDGLAVGSVIGPEPWSSAGRSLLCGVHVLDRQCHSKPLIVLINQLQQQ